MCILLCLCNSCLLKAVSCEPLAECIGNFNLVECYRLVGNRRIVFGEAYVFNIKSLSVKALKIIITECSCDLSCSVRSEVKEYNWIAIIYSCNWLISIIYNSWNNKFIKYFFLIWTLNSWYSWCCFFSFSKDHCIISLFFPLPSFVSIHSIESSTNWSNFPNTFFFHLFF